MEIMGANGKDDAPRWARELSADVKASLAEARKDRRQIADILHSHTKLFAALIGQNVETHKLLRQILRAIRVQGNGHARA